MGVLASARARRRAAWLGALVGVAVGVAAVIVLLPKGEKSKETFRPGAQVVRTPRKVPFTAARRREVNALLDQFIPAAVERKQPLQALPLVTDDFRAGVTREEWARGELPVFPYQAEPSSFHSWRVNYSYPTEMSIELLLHPTAKEELGSLAYIAVFKKTRGRWLIDSFVNSASFAPQHKKPKILAQPDFKPFAETRGSARLDSRWLLLPAGLLGVLLCVPLGIGVARFRRSRRAWRDYRATLD
jgi:hypothetical protein